MDFKKLVREPISVRVRVGGDDHIVRLREPSAKEAAAVREAIAAGIKSVAKNAKDGVADPVKEANTLTSVCAKALAVTIVPDDMDGDEREAMTDAEWESAVHLTGGHLSDLAETAVSLCGVGAFARVMTGSLADAPARAPDGGLRQQDF